ncbi:MULTISPECIES: TetR/AcrR family transcriptional regulator [Vibrio]|uniref:TetR/AcrR family transcriptional regulator n=1 Tax=Vibrio TaxID=662 RepID=UPI0012683B1A|nr:MULTISPECIES: TetR/AcrR family transcriptional regulator [Vibrio]QFT39940.1 Transcriptional regulator, TetR family [Vibrio sp. THAF64]QGM37553.1 Transcriptional regulator, TetR family [Vibrio sp. THAF191d]QGN73278.1 Transcriptional regulator, TetR family [Vibrio sp. THAF191c]WFB51204.1 TetR/AcrR family transcriptional regulator [Vibrio coralliilyticus]
MSNTTVVKPGRPVDHERTRRMFDAIDTVLVEEGVAGLSIEKVAKIANVSKVTLYRRFGTLESMLRAYVEYYTSQAAHSIQLDATVRLDVRSLEEQLIVLGIDTLNLIGNPRVIAFDNALLGSGQLFGDLREQLYVQGPKRLHERIAQLLLMAGIESDIEDLADILFHLWRSGIYDAARVKGNMTVTESQLYEHVASRTRFFLRSVTMGND